MGGRLDITGMYLFWAVESAGGLSSTRSNSGEHVSAHGANAVFLVQGLPQTQMQSRLALLALNVE